MSTTRTWAIAGVSAALILGSAGVTYAVTAASDDAPPTAIEHMQLRLDHHADYGTPTVGAYGAGYGDQTQDRARDHMRDQLRDTENCDGGGSMGDGSMGDGSMGGGSMGGGSMGGGSMGGGSMGDGSRAGGMMGGYGSGR